MIKAHLKLIPNKCPDFLALNFQWEYIFNCQSKISKKARNRRRQRGVGSFPKLRRWVRILLADDEITDISGIRQKLNGCPDIISWAYEQPDEPCYNPTDPDVTNDSSYGWSKMKLVATTGETAFDLEKGDGIVIGIIESAGAGANYTVAELGGTGNKTNDWAAIQAGTHAKFVDYTNPSGTSIDPYGTGHGNTTSRHAASVIDNATAYCGSCPDAKIMMAVGQDFDEAIQRMADLGVDVISVSYSNTYSHRTAIQYAIASGVVVVYSHGGNSHLQLSTPLLFEAITVGGFNTSDVSDRSYGEGLTVIGRGVTSSSESWSTAAVAGICGLIIAANPTWNVADIYSALITACQKPSEMGSDAWHIQYGWGIPDAHASLGLSLSDLKPLPPLVFDVNWQNNQGAVLTWENLETTNFDRTEVYRTTGSFPTTAKTGTRVYAGGATTFTDVGAFADATTYYYHAVAIDANGNESDYALPVQESALSSGLKITPVENIWHNELTLRLDNIPSGLSYVYDFGDESGDYDFSVSSDSSSMMFTGLNGNDDYYYAVTLVTTTNVECTEQSHTMTGKARRIVNKELISPVKNAVESQLLSNSTIANHNLYFAEVAQDEDPETTSGYVRWNATFGDEIPEFNDELELSDISISIFSRSLSSVAALHKEVMRQLDNTSLSISGHSHIHTQRTTGHLPPDREIGTRLWHQVLRYELIYE